LFTTVKSQYQQIFIFPVFLHFIAFSSSNMGEFSKDVRMLAALEESENDGDKLMDAARRLAGAFSELLTVAQPGANEVANVRIVLCGVSALSKCSVLEMNFCL